MKTFYAAINYRGNQTNIGFADTWDVLAFGGKSARDRYVAAVGKYNKSARAIKKSEIGQYIDRPAPFSGKCWVIDQLCMSGDADLMVEHDSLGVVISDVLCGINDRRRTVY